MGRHAPVIDTDLDPDIREPVESWLAAVVNQLPQPVRSRSDPLLAELADGLLNAVAAHEAAGLRPARAAEAAIAEFGDPAVLAEAFIPELAAVDGRRTALLMIRTGPMVGALWLTGLLAGPATIHAMVGPLRWQGLTGLTGLTGDWPAILLLGLIVAFLLTAAVVFTSTGRLSRWLPCHPRLAPTATAIASAICVVCDLTVFAIFASQIVAAPRSIAWAPAVAASLASLVRLVLAGRAAHRCLLLRATLA